MSVEKQSCLFLLCKLSELQRQALLSQPVCKRVGATVPRVLGSLRRHPLLPPVSTELKAEEHVAFLLWLWFHCPCSLPVRSDCEGHDMSGVNILGVKGELARSRRQDKLAPIAAVWNEYLERCHRLLELKGIIGAIFPRLLFYR